jgi:hypothetical protein
MKDNSVQPVATPAAPERAPDPQPPTRGRNTSRLNRTFAETPAVAEPDEIDPVARAVLAHIAGQLGIRADQIQIRNDPEARMIVTSRNADGVARNGIVYLRSETLDFTSRTGRRVIAHEVAHIAQSLLPDAATQPLKRVPAEVEAETFAERYVSTRTGAPVRIPLPAHVAAADKDFAALVETVAKSRSQEIERIVDLLSYGLLDWAVTDGDVFDVLHILNMFPMLTARAMMRNAGAKYRKRLFSNLNPPHYSEYRTEILATCWAAESEDEFASENYQILNFLSLKNLDPLEAVAVSYVVDLSPKVEQAATADAARAKSIAEAREYAKSEKGESAVSEGLKEAHTEEEQAAAAREKKDASLDDLAKRIRSKLNEFIVTDDEARELLDAVADQCLPFKDPADKFQALANALTPSVLDDFIGQIPAKALYQTERRRKAYVYLVATRPPFKNEQIAENLMSSPWWQFWDTITSEEAFLAYLLVKSMPTRARAAFLKARGGERWGQIIDELPENIRESASFNLYTGGLEQSDRQALLTELLDDKIWSAAQKDRLDATIRMARAAGEAEFVFEQSKKHRANTVPELKPIVEKYQLFVEGKRETYQEKPLEGHAWYQEGIFAKIAGAYRFLAIGLRYLFGSSLNLNTLHDYGGVPLTGDAYSPYVRGARFHEATKQEDKEAKKQTGVGVNIVTIDKQDSKGQIVVSAPRMLIDQLSIAGETTVTAAPVTCSALRLDVRFSPESYKPESLEAGFDELTISDCAMVKADSIYSVNSLKMTQVRLRLTNEAFGETKKQDGLAAMFLALLYPEKATGVYLAFQSMELSGVATSSGSFVQKVEIGGLTIQAGGNKDAYTDALSSSLARLNKRIQEEESAEFSDLEHTAQHQEAKAWLEKQRDGVDAELKKGSPQGSVIDIKSIKVSGIPGLADEPVELSDIHGQGSSVAAVVPLFADPTRIRDMIRGSEAAPTIRGKQAGEEQFNIAIRGIHTKGPIRITGAIPTAAQARKEVDDFETNNKASRSKEGYEAVLNALKERVDDAEKYQTLANKGVQNLGDQVDEFRRLRARLLAFEERRATIIESLDLAGVTLNIAGDGNPELIAETLSAKGIKTFTPDGRENLHIGEVSGEGVSMSAAFTGGLANAAEWRKNFEGAGLKARQLTLKDIRHAGSDAVIEELTFEGDNEEKGLEATFERRVGQEGGATVGIKSRKIVAKGVNIPAHAALLRAELERIEKIPEKDRLPEEVKRRDTILTMLKDFAQIQKAKQAAEATAGSPSTKPKEKAAAQKQIAASDQALKDWEERLRIDKLTIEHLDIALTGLGDVLAPDYSFDRDAPEVAIEGRGAQGHWLESAEVEGVRTRTATGDQVVAEKITVGAVGGKAKKTKTGGYALEGFTVGKLSVQGVSYASGALKVQAIGETTLNDISIDATYEPGQGQADLTITKLDIGRIVANNLRYEDADKIVTVVSGELDGVHILNMHVTLPEDKKAKKTIEGSVSIDEIKSLTVNAAASGYNVHATVNAAKPQGEEAHAIQVDFAKSGEIGVSLDGLSGAADVMQPAKGNKVHVTWKNLGGKVVKNGDDYTVTGLTAGNLTLSRMNWQAGNKQIFIDDQVTLTGITLDLEASLQPKKKAPGSKPAKATSPDEEPEEPEKELSKLLIKKLAVDKIDAREVSVWMAAVEEDKAKGVEFSPQKAFHLEQAVVRGLTVTGFDVLNMHGKVEVSKSISVTNLRASIGEVARDNIKVATASFTMYGKDAEEPGMDGRELSATLTAKDGTIIRLGRTDSLNITDIWSTVKDKDKSGALQTTQANVDKVSLKGITAGDLIIKDDMISISDIEIAGPIGIVNLNWSVTGKSTQKITMESATVPDLVKIGGIRADFKKVPTGKIVAGKETTKSELDKLTVSAVAIPKLFATKLHYFGPLESKKGVKTVDLDLPTATANGIEIASVSKSFADNLLSVDATIKSVSAPNFTAKLVETIKKTTTTKNFGADITTGEIRANAILKTVDAGKPTEKTEIADGYFELDSVGLRNVTGNLGESGKQDKTIGHDSRFAENLPDGPGVDLKSIRTDKTGTTVGSASIRGVTYKDPNTGLTLDIQELAVPNTTTIPNKGPITIPEATITNAYFHVDDLLALKSSDEGGGKSTPIDKEQFYGILDHVDGYFKAQVYAPIYVGEHWYLLYRSYLRQDVFPVDMQIKDGKFKYGDVWDKATWLRNDVFASLDMDTDEVKTDRFGHVLPDMSKSYLTLSVASYNILEWTPGDEAERSEMRSGEARLKRIIRPDDNKSQAEKDKEAKAEEERKKKGERSTVEPGEIELRNVDANLGIKGYIPLDLGSTGRIALGTKTEDALTELKLKSKTTSQLQWSLEQMAVTIDELNFGTTKVRGDKPGGAEIHISKVENGKLTFTNGKVMSPKELEGTVTSASVKNLAIEIGD